MSVSNTAIFAKAQGQLFGVFLLLEDFNLDQGSKMDFFRVIMFLEVCNLSHGSMTELREVILFLISLHTIPAEDNWYKSHHN